MRATRLHDLLQALPQAISRQFTTITVLTMTTTGASKTDVTMLMELAKLTLHAEEIALPDTTAPSGHNPITISPLVKQR